MRRAPDEAGRALGRLELYTPDGTNELVELIAERHVDHRDWVDVRTSLRLSGTTGWVPRSALSEFHLVDTWLVVDKQTLRASLIRNGIVIFSAPIGIGAQSTPTPDGIFYVRDRLSGFG
ncbi:MAG TPA: L,D-transpeptidase family protein, partial [Polyangiaceae bacterium]|nr:L,D-transpeptidase family protein [Polyangiaceae bacterium]